MRGSDSPPYRLLVCDLDGTLMGEDTTIPPRVKDALDGVRSRGVQVTLATGRSYRATLPFARALNITLPLICFQGGLIQHPETDEVLHRARMERSLTLEIIQLARARGWHLVIYLDDDVYVEEFQYPRSFYHKWLGPDLHQVDDLTQAVCENGHAPTKFILVAQKARADRIQEELSAHFGPAGRRLVIVRSHELFVEGNPLGVDKGEGLRRLAQHLDVPRERVMAIGDQDNDVPMIAWAGLGIAMGSGSAAARSVADWIAPPLSAHGAVVAIERFLHD